MITRPIWSLPEAIGVQSGQSTIVVKNNVLLVLHKPPGPDDRAQEGMLFWRNPAVEWQFNRGSPGTGGLNRHVQSYMDREIKLTAEYERAADVNTPFDLVETLTRLVRVARNLFQAIPG